LLKLKNSKTKLQVIYLIKINIYFQYLYLKALREFKQLAIKPFLIPGDSGFALVGLLNAPTDKNDGDSFRNYFKQAREELSYRLAERLFNADGTKNKWWQVYSFPLSFII
jgi:hypothetical protein